MPAAESLRKVRNKIMKTHPHLELVRKYARASQRAVLSSDEKAKMRGELLQHIKASPVAVSSEAIPARAPRVSSPYSKYLKRTGRVVAPLMLVIIIIGGGTSYAAESSLPGDLLYPVKIHVNESVVSDFSFTALSQAKWAVQKVKRRLAEAKAIGLQTAAKVGLDAAVVAETDDADVKIAALDASDPTDAGALTQQLAGLVQDDGIDASTSPIDVDLSTSTDTTSTQVSNKVVHTVKSEGLVPAEISVPSTSASPAPSVVLPVTTSANVSTNVSANPNVSTGAAATVHVNANASVSVPAVPVVPAVSTPTVTTPTITTPTVSAPAVTVPSVTVPAVTVPAVTLPSVSVPSAAASAASAVGSVKSGLSL